MIPQGPAVPLGEAGVRSGEGREGRVVEQRVTCSPVFGGLFVGDAVGHTATIRLQRGDIRGGTSDAGLHVGAEVCGWIRERARRALLLSAV